jgi:hypothetical protein
VLAKRQAQGIDNTARQSLVSIGGRTKISDKRLDNITERVTREIFSLKDQFPD